MLVDRLAHVHLQHVIVVTVTEVAYSECRGVVYIGAYRGNGRQPEGPRQRHMGHFPIVALQTPFSTPSPSPSLLGRAGTRSFSFIGDTILLS